MPHSIKHQITIYAHELPDDLRDKLNQRFEQEHGTQVPAEDRQLKIEVEAFETDPAKVKVMLLEQLAR